MKQLIGLDLGTTGAKALVINSQGEVLASNSEGYPLYQEEQGWSEQKTEDWLNSIIQALKKVLSAEEVNRKQVEGIALSGQMHGSIFLDEHGGVIRDPILWNDTRTSNQCREIRELVGEDHLIELVGNTVLEGFTAPKLLWLRKNEPENYSELETLLLPKDYITYRLTGRLITEKSDAAGTSLYDVEEETWSKEVCGKLKIEDSILPEVLNSVDVVEKIKPDVADKLDLPADVKVIAGGADNACSAIGNGIVEEGLLLASIGSSGVILAHTDSMQTDQEGRIHSFNHAKPGKWYLMGVMLAAGLSYRWFRDTFSYIEQEIERLSKINTYKLLNKEAAQVPPGSEGLVFLPYLNGERTPHKNPKARGVLFGISSNHDKRHFVRSIMEGVTFGLKDSLELIKGLGVNPAEIRITGGGGKSKLWKQIQADVFGKEVATTAVDEGPAFGAALLAGVGSGVFNSVNDAVDKSVEVVSKQYPDPENNTIYNDLYPIYRSLYDSLKEDYEKLAKFRSE